MEQTSEKKWFAIRVTYNRELKVKVELEAKGIECFVPMSYKEVLQPKVVFRRHNFQHESAHKSLTL